MSEHSPLLERANASTHRTSRRAKEWDVIHVDRHGRPVAPRPSFFRGLLYGFPISAGLWGGLYMLFRALFE